MIKKLRKKQRVHPHGIKSRLNIEQTSMTEASVIMLSDIFKLLRIQGYGSAVTFGQLLVATLETGATTGA
jgi:hypothetical protein